MRVFAALAAAVLLTAACAPKAPPLRGAVTPMPLPRAELRPGHTRMVFRWKLTEPDVTMSGEGIARIAAPDSARLDFFVGEGGAMGSGRAILIGGELEVPGFGFFQRFLPDEPLLWATLGRLAVPAASDTVIRVDGDTLRADIGGEDRWRVAFVDGSLSRLERIGGGRLQEMLVRWPNGAVRYERPSARRVLEITVVGTSPASPFDASIWQ